MLGSALYLMAFAVTATLSQDVPSLTILPSGDSIRRDLGKTGFFTCQPADGFEDLIEDVVWIDPQGVEIPNEQNSPGQQLPRIYSSPDATGKVRELFFDRVMEQDSGNYTCRARYASNQEITKTFNLVVYMSIRFEDAPEQQNPIQGEPAKIKCVVRASPVAIVEWFKDGQLIRSGGRYVVEQDGLVIQDVSSEDDGTYICRAKVPTEGELKERLINVEVYSQPTIILPEPGTEVEVVENERGSIRCQAEGKPVPTRTWVDPNNADVSNIAGLSVDPRDGTLNFDPASRDMAGQYLCIAENDVGRAETSVSVIVVVKPDIVKYENATVNEGNTAVLECHVTGSPLPTVEFRKVGNTFRFEQGTFAGDDRITVDQREEEGGRVGILTITDLKRSDDGLYECIAQNKGGQKILNGHITTQFKPSFESSPIREIYTWDYNPVNLTCVAESIPNATIVWEFKRNFLEPGIDTNFVQHGNGPTSYLEVTPADDTYYGMFTCKASNLLGVSTLDIELFKATVPSRLTDVVFKEVTATTVSFQMNGPSNDGGLPLVAYAVQYKLAGQAWDAKLEELWPVGSNYVLTQLQPEQVYVFRFAAKNDVGLSEWSAEQQMVMPTIDVPEPPVIEMPDSMAVPEESGDLVVTSVYPDVYTVAWRAGANNGEKIDNFQISFYKVVNTENGWRTVSDKRTSVVDFPGTQMFKLTRLKPASHYRIELRAHNRLGYGQPAQVIVKTAPGTQQTGSAGSTLPVTSTTTAATLAAAEAEPAPAQSEQTRPSDGDGDASSPVTASGLVIGVVIGVLLVLLLLIDLTCYAVNSRGITYTICSRARHSSGTAKLNEDVTSEKEPLRENGNDTKKAPEANGESDVPEVKIDSAQLDAAKDSAV